MEKNFFTIQLTDEQKKMFGDQNVHELVAVDYKKINKSTRSNHDEADILTNFPLTDSQKQVVEVQTKMSHQNVKVLWKPSMSSIGKSDIKSIENNTLRSCDTWSVPTSDSV